MVVKSQTLPIYGSRIHIVIISNNKEDLPKFNQEFGHSFTEETSPLGMSERRQGHILIYVNVEQHKKKFKKLWEVEVLATIAHEAVHACNQIFRDKGIKLSLTNDEPQAYLTDWIVKEIFKLYIKQKQKEE